MKNFVQPGNALTLVAPAAVLSGAGVLVGTLFGVAQADAASGADVEVARSGVFNLAKAASQSWTQGAKIYWDDTAKNCTTTASGNTLVGAAAIAAGSADTTGRVVLTGQIV